MHQDIKSCERHLSLGNKNDLLVDFSQNSLGRGKISDFGFALELPKVCGDGRSMFTAKTFARSEGYFPSELTSGKYSAKSDVY